MPFSVSPPVSPPNPVVQIVGTTTVIEPRGRLRRRASRRLLDLADRVFDDDPECVVLELGQLVDINADGLAGLSALVHEASARQVKLVILPCHPRLRDATTRVLDTLDSETAAPTGIPEISWRTLLDRSWGC